MSRVSLTAVSCGALGIFLFVMTAHATSPRERLKQIDINGDRVIQFSEIYSLRATIFDEKIDQNHNGFLDREEFEQVQSRIAGSGRQNVMEAIPDPSLVDRNGDGTISRDEFVHYLSPRVLAADSNKDGQLVRSELRALR